MFPTTFDLYAKCEMVLNRALLSLHDFSSSMFYIIPHTSFDWNTAFSTWLASQSYHLAVYVTPLWKVSS